jgi:acetate kinase
MFEAHSSPILTINAGSSSIKFSLHDQQTLTPLRVGAIERISMDGTFIEVRDVTPGTTSRKDVAGDSTAALLDALRDVRDNLCAVGYRVVHGGEKYTEPTLLTSEVIDTLTSISAYAPQHLPVEIALIRAFMEYLPHIPHIACFDTAFHSTMPNVSRILPLPIEYRNGGVRRYGFHGLSYTSVCETLKETFGVPIAEKRIIIAHLGSGASLAALQNGVSVDTTMGFTPNSGIAMGTRSGDIDGGLFTYFTDTVGLTPEEFNHLVNYESGLLAISGMSADMETLLREAPHHPSAEEAVSYFAMQVRKQIGALTAVLGGIDILVFTGGIGERSPLMRARIVDGLSFLGIELDTRANEDGAHCISPNGSAVSVYSIPTNEERVIAHQVAELLPGLSVTTS